jgi:hydrogenase maturation protease
VKDLEKMDLPPNVEVYDADTNAFAVLEFMNGKDKAVIIDAYMGDGEPGSLYKLSFNPRCEEPPENFNLSLHDFTFADAIRSGEGIYELPREIIIIGVEPKEINLGLELSHELERIKSKVIEEVMRELE